MNGTADTFKWVWQRLVSEVAKGRTQDVHAARKQLLSVFEKQLQYLRIEYGLTADAALYSGISSMEHFKARVLDPWQTADDLEELAARDYPLTNEDLDRIGPQRQPPAAYYADDNKPF